MNFSKKTTLPWRTCDKAGAPTLFACGEWYARPAWYCLRQWYALRAFETTKANRISLRPSGAISLLRSENITLSCARHITEKLYHPTLHPKGVTHYTLQGKVCEKEHERKCSCSFCCIAVSKICFMVGIRVVPFLFINLKFQILSFREGRPLPYGYVFSTNFEFRIPNSEFQI